MVSIHRKSLMAALVSSSLFLTYLAVSTRTQAETTLVQRVPYTKIIDNGPDKDRIVLLVTGEGYSKEQASVFKNDVDRLIEKWPFRTRLFPRQLQSIQRLCCR